jgi:hypothetical protein
MFSFYNLIHLRLAFIRGREIFAEKIEKENGETERQREAIIRYAYKYATFLQALYIPTGCRLKAPTFLPHLLGQQDFK